MNISNNFKKYIFRTVLLSAFTMGMAESSFSIENMNGTEPKNQDLKRTTATNRLKFAKECLESNPGMTMTTKLENKEGSSCSLFSLYEWDQLFILENTKNRVDAPIIREQMGALDEQIKLQGWDKEMSFADYNFIGYVFTTILTEWKGQYLNLPDILQTYQDALIDKTKIFSTLYDYKPFVFITSQGLVLPHISQTGAVPIRIMNDSCGFFVGLDNQNVSYVDFLGVGTNEQLRFDFTTDGTADQSWEHDLDHTKSATKVKKQLDQEINPLKYAYKIAVFRKHVLEQLKDNPEEQKLFELGHFAVFHENEPTTAFDDLFQVIKKYYIVINRVKENNSRHHILNTRGKDTQTQYETEIAGAISLKIDITGNSYEERVQDYLDKLLLGLKILEKYASVYNEATYSK
jgi:hypothetical protein